MKRVVTAFALAIAIAALLYVGLAGGGHVEAQLDPGNFELYQSGVKVGEVFVPDRDRNARNYLEHWVLLPEYVNPGEGRGSTEIRPVASGYESTRDFFRRAPFPEGSRYVIIGAHESRTLPGR
jgi:hypothetical protein